MKKEDKRTTAAFVLVILVIFTIIGVTTFFSCEDSRGEKREQGVEYMKFRTKWTCEDCRASFSEHEHFRLHKCNKIFSEETDRKLKRLAHDLELYGINYPKEPNKVWGQGDPDPNHIKYFGNNNLSRLCFVQTLIINRQGQLLAELALRIRKLEDPNNARTPNKNKSEKD